MTSIVANKKVDAVTGGSIDHGTNPMLWNQMGNSVIVNPTPIILESLIAPPIDTKSNVMDGLNANVNLDPYSNIMKIESMNDKNNEYTLSHDGEMEVKKKEIMRRFANPVGHF